VQVLGAGNTENLLDRVGDFPEHWTQDDGRHGARGSAPAPCRSNHERDLSTADEMRPDHLVDRSSPAE
jgi:hypothetical protein